MRHKFYEKSHIVNTWVNNMPVREESKSNSYDTEPFLCVFVDLKGQALYDCERIYESLSGKGWYLRVN